MWSSSLAIKQSVKRPKYWPQVLVADCWMCTVLSDHQHKSEAGKVEQSAHIWSEHVGESLVRVWLQTSATI